MPPLIVPPGGTNAERNTVAGKLSPEVGAYAVHPSPTSSPSPSPEPRQRPRDVRLDSKPPLDRGTQRSHSSDLNVAFRQTYQNLLIAPEPLTSHPGVVIPIIKEPTVPDRLTSLPGEILSAIALHLSSPDALSLTYTAKCFAKHAERSLWRDLDLSTTQRYGKEPKSNAFAAAFALARRSSERKADDVYIARLRRRTTSFLQRGDERKWGMTESVRLVNRDGPVTGIIEVLERVSTSLKMLKMEATLPHIDDQHDYQLERVMIDSRLSFPSLTHITLERSSYRFPGFIHLLLSITPNLSYLAIETESDGQRFPLTGAFPTFVGPTALRQLHVTLSSSSRSHLLVEQLLNQSPKLEQVSLHGTTASYRTRLQSHTNLVQLSLALSLSEVWRRDSSRPVKPPTSSLRTLILHQGAWDDILRYLPKLPALDTIYLRQQPTSRRPPPDADLSLTEVEMNGMFSTLLEGIRGCPRLRSVRAIDFVELGPKDAQAHQMEVLRGEPIGIIRSMRHGSEELLYAKLYIAMREATDKLEEEPGEDVEEGKEAADKREEYEPVALAASKVPMRPDPPTSHEEYPSKRGDGRRDHHTYYIKVDGSIRVKTFGLSPVTTWQHFSDYDGVAVPYEVIKEMLDVEGLSDAKWTGRGLEVGEMAWKVLTDWDEKREEAM